MKTRNDFKMIFDRFGSLSDGTKKSTHELIFLYLEAMSVHMAELAEAVKSAEAKNMGLIAHTASGLNEMIGAFSLSSLFRDLESKAHAGRFDGVKNTLKEINEEFELARKRFREYAESLTASP